jgi:hypothetical protein
MGAERTACGYVLSETIYNVWTNAGGQDGRLGCATARESTSPPSPAGSAARVAVFGLNGEIVLHTSGPRAGQAYAVTGCFYRLYVQFSGTSGWLGLPTGDLEGTPDGSRQAFEGGSMTYDRAAETCDTEANPTAEAPTPPPASMTEVPLVLYENPATGDRLSLAAGGSEIQAMGAGYQALRPQARVMTDSADGAIRLKLYEDEAKGIWLLLATPESEREALAAGLTFQAGQGFVWADPRPGLVALKLYRDGEGRGRLTAGPQDEADATAKGFQFVRIEGYADPAQ